MVIWSGNLYIAEINCSNFRRLECVTQALDNILRSVKTLLSTNYVVDWLVKEVQSAYFAYLKWLCVCGVQTYICKYQYDMKWIFHMTFVSSWFLQYVHDIDGITGLHNCWKA